MIEFFSKFRKQLLAIFDVEGVLYDGEYLPILAEKLNKEKEIWDITKKGIQGLINWEDGLKKRVDNLRNDIVILKNKEKYWIKILEK